MTDRNRDARRGTMAVTNGALSRRRHRSSSLRDSPEEDGQIELQEPARLRDRGVKKDRDRDRDRERDRDRDRLNRNKRRRGDRLIHGGNREDGGEDSTEESVNDEEEEDDDDGVGGGVSGGAVRMLPPNPAAAMSNHQHNHQQRKSFPPAAAAAKVFRATAPSWKAADEMIGVSVPRKARSASTKRAHECWISGGVGGEQIHHRQASTSPVRPNQPSPSPAPVSPSSSNASVRKKMKPNGSKPRPPKSSSKSSSNPEELEIEIAEVLYGLKTHQGPSKKEIMANDLEKFDSRDASKSSSHSKSRVSSPISNSPSTAPQATSSSTAPLSAVAPKRKRPRQVSDNIIGSYGIRSSPISSATKVEIDQPPKTEISSPNLEKISGSVAENGGVAYDLGISMAAPLLSEPPTETTTKPENSESKPLTEEAGESRDVAAAKEEVASPKKGSPAVRAGDDREDVTVTKANSIILGVENNREEKFLIDLMAPPPQLRSSPEREGANNFSSTAADHKSMVSDVEMRPSVKDKEEDKAMKSGKEDGINKQTMEPEEKKVKLMVEEAELKKPVVVSKERIIDLQLDLEKPDRDSGIGSTGVHRLNHHVPKPHQQLKATKEEPHPEKTVQATSLPLPMSVASWPSGLSPMGYMAPLQGVVSMDGSTMPSTPLQPFLSQPRPKRCATHCYIARNIQCLQQFMKMNSSFWPAAAGSASLFGAKPGSLNVVPAAELHGNIAGRSINSVQDKGQTLAVFPGHTGKDKGSQAANIADVAQRKQQILLQQAMPQGVPPSNILHGPAFIFPLSQQQAAVAAASVRPAAAKSPTITGGVASSNASSSASASSSATAAAAVSFNYPNMPASETQYLAILQNNGYPFPIPAVGAPPNYRGTHAQAMPYFNGSFYSSQMIHPSQLQHQQQQPPPSAQSQQMQTGHQNSSLSSGSSSSQKHLQSQQQRPQGSSANGGSGSGNLNSFPAPKNRSSQPPQQQSIQHIPQTHQARQLENEVGGEDSPSTADSSRVSRAIMGVYGQNFAMPIHPQNMPIHPQNFALMTPPVLASSSSNASGGGGNQSEKKQHQQSQQLGMKAGVETLPPQTFAMSFASMNGNSTPPGIDISSMAHNHAILQSLPEATRQTFQIMVAANAAQVAQQQKKNFRASEEAKSGGGDTASADEEKKGLAGKVQTPFGQSIAFSRPDLADPSVSSISGNNVIDSSASSARNLNLVSGPARTSRAAMANPSGTVNGPNSQLHAQMQQHQHQQNMIQLQKHHQQQQQQQQQQQMAAVAAGRSKTPATSNGSVYSEHLTSSPSMAAKFPNSISGFPQNLVQSNSSNSPTHSPQWKNPVRTTTSQVPSSLASATSSSSHKNLPQQQARTQQNHTQISFGASPKSSTPNTNQSPSPPMVVGSPTTSSISKGASGSPRTTSTSTGNKATQPSSLSSQQTKNSPSVPSRKSSPVGGRNVPSIIGNPTSTGTKPQIQQQQLPKHNLQQQPHLFFSNAYMSAQQASHSTSTSSTAQATSGYYLQRRRADQSLQTHQPPGSSTSTSTGMLSLCPPVTLTSTTTSDPAKAIAAASNMKGGGYPAQFVAQPSGNTHQLLPAGFPYVHAVPAAVQVKPAEQKQPAGNDNLHACWQPEKK